MKFKLTVILLFIFIIPALPQNDAKIDKKLNRLYAKGKLEKCYKKAIKLNNKYPVSDIPEFYITKIMIEFYADSNSNQSKRYNSLRKAVTYSLRLPQKYDTLKTSIQDSLLSYINVLHEENDSTRCQRVLKFYTKTYKDTTSLYEWYFLPKQQKVSLVGNEELIYKNISHNSVSDSLRFELLKFAEELNGISYRYGGENPETGFDCSGFTKYVYNHIGIELPHNAHQQSLLEGNKKELKDAQAGDLIFFGSQFENSYSTVHAGIIYLVKDDTVKVIHCVSRGVSIDGENSSWEHYWKDRILFVKTLPKLN